MASLAEEATSPAEKVVISLIKAAAISPIEEAAAEVAVTPIAAATKSLPPLIFIIRTLLKTLKGLRAKN